jgi:hypothetical protein
VDGSVVRAQTGLLRAQIAVPLLTPSRQFSPSPAILRDLLFVSAAWHPGKKEEDSRCP